MALLNKKRHFHGTVLYHQRVNLGLNQQQIGTKIGRTKNCISRWETGKCKPNPRSLFMLAKALRVKPEFFFIKNVKSQTK